jgi:hypothetical protein
MNVFNITQWKIELDCAKGCGGRGLGAADMPASWSVLIGWKQSSNVQTVLKLEGWNPEHQCSWASWTTEVHILQLGVHPPMLWELGVKLLGHETDHSYPSSAEVADRYSRTLLHTFLYGMYRDSFTFMLCYWFFWYVLPCDYAVLSTINTEHHIYLNVRWSCTLDSLPFTVSIFQEVIYPKHV